MDEELLDSAQGAELLNVEIENDLEEVEGAADAEIHDFFMVLVKTIRAAQLYVQGNPLLHQFIGDLEARLARLWDVVPTLTFTVHESEMRWQNRTVYRERAGRAENLAFQFYRDGIRRIEFRPGVEEDELRQFIDILRLSKRLREEEDDLLTLMWNADFEHIRYEYVDVLGDDPPLPTPTLNESGEEVLASLPSLELSPELETRTLREDFEPSLYFLDEQELSHLQHELRREWDRPVKRDVLLGILDQYEMGDDERRREVVDILRKILPRVLADGEFSDAAFIIVELRKIAETRGDPEITAEIENIVGELSDPIILDQLVRLMEDGSVDVKSDELATLLDALRPEAITVLLHAIPLVSQRTVREVLYATLERLARMNPGLMASLVRSPEAKVAAEAARIAGKLSLSDATEAIAALLERQEKEVRLAAVEALTALRTSMAGNPLLQALSDESRDVRVGAARGLAQLRYRPGYRDLEKHLNNNELKGRDLTEQLALFEAYGRAAGEEGVRLLSRMLNGRRLLWIRYPAQIRACAARALGMIGGEAAMAALNGATQDRDPVVTTAVHRALRGKQEGMDEER